jgi:hypothetical protein
MPAGHSWNTFQTAYADLIRELGERPTTSKERSEYWHLYKVANGYRTIALENLCRTTALENLLMRAPFASGESRTSGVFSFGSVEPSMPHHFTFGGQ